jgi:hypothetical protein
MNFFTLKRESLGCLESRFVSFQENGLFQDVELSSSENPSKTFFGHKMLLAAISQKLRLEFAKKENLGKVSFFKYKH